jgi:hypothetical protein
MDAAALFNIEGFVSGRPGMYDWVHRDIQEEAIRRAIGLNMSDAAVGVYANVSSRTVLRYRKKHNIPSNFARRENIDAS